MNRRSCARVSSVSAQPSPGCPSSVVSWHEGVVEEDFVELCLAVGLFDGPHIQLRIGHVDQEHAQAAVLGILGSVRARHNPQSARWAWVVQIF